MPRPRLVLSLVVGLVAVGPLVPSASASAPRCLGRVATQVLTGRGGVLRGTQHSDVLVSTAPGATILGLGGDDRICATGAAVIDSGKGRDQIQVPARELGLARIPVSSGDSLDGFNLDVDQPASGGPVFGLDLNGDLVGKKPLRSSFASLGLVDVATAPGRNPRTWRVDFGDGTRALTGRGLPELRSHAWARPGRHTITVSLTDDHGSTTKHTAVVDAVDPSAPSLDGLAFSGGTTTGTTVHTLISSPSAPIASWALDYGDGTEQTGSGPLPASFDHTYPEAASYTMRVQVETAHGERAVKSSYLRFGSAASHTVDFLSRWSAAEPIVDYDIGVDRVGAAARHLAVGQPLRVETTWYGGTTTLVDAGDGSGPQPTRYLERNIVQGRELSYAKPGTYSLTVIARTDGQPDVVTSYPIVVSAPRNVARITAPKAALEGPLTWDLSHSTVTAGSTWTISDAVGEVSGTAALPKALHRVTVAGTRTVGLAITNPVRLLTDTTSLDYTSVSRATTQVRTLGTHVGSISTLSRIATDQPYRADASIHPVLPHGVRIRAVTVTIDGQSRSLGTATVLEDSDPANPVLADGVHTITFTVLDSQGRKARASTTVTVSGPSR